MAAKLKFTYEIINLIEAVESKPCVWDKTSEDYKNKHLKERAWKEVCSFLEKNYDSMDDAQQKKIDEMVMDKWRNVRDAFSKSLKKRSGQANTKKYLYHDNLQFLLKILDKDETCSSLAEEELHDDQSEEPQHDESENENTRNIQQRRRHPVQVSTTLSGTSGDSRNRKQRIASDNDKIDKALLKALQTSPQQQHQPDEDESFFLSLLPSVRNMTQDEKLQFRVDVLQLIQRNKRRRMESVQSPSNYSETSASYSRQTSPDPSPASSSHSILQVHYSEPYLPDFMRL